MARGFTSGGSSQISTSSLKKMLYSAGESAKVNDMNSMYKKAFEIAKKAHEGQFRRDGKTPYFNHIEQVVNNVDGIDAKTVALLHDTVEDGRVSFKDLEDAGLPKNIVDGVRAMTRPKDMAYQDYVRDIVLKNDLARKVKFADINVNLKDSPSDWQLKKYTAALKLFV